MPVTVDDLIADYDLARGHLRRQIVFLEEGGRIAPAGATEQQVVAATSAWLAKLKKFAIEYDEIIADLRRISANGRSRANDAR